MLLSSEAKKKAWIFPFIIFLVILIYKIITDGFVILLSPLSVGIFIAIFQLLYNNIDAFRVPFNFLYYTFFNIQFELVVHANISGDKESMSKIDSNQLRTIISEIYKSDKLQNRIREINLNRNNKAGGQYEVYLAPYGINLKIDLDHGVEDSMIRIHIESQKKYRQIKRMYQNFLKVFLNEIENKVNEKNSFQYSVKVFPETKEKNFFAAQYLKNISKVEHFSIYKKQGAVSYEINSSYISINSKYLQDILDNTTKVMLRIK